VPLENDISNNRPVILSAFSSGNPVGHVWVGDGIYSFHQTCPNNSYYYLHMNWGWGGNYNGWYFNNNWNPGGVNYTVNQFALTNIHL
jgi:hypothetical protein